MKTIIDFKKSRHSKVALLIPVGITAVIVLVMQMKWIEQNADKFVAVTSVEQIPCDYCDGRGIIKNPEDPGEFILCPICFGVGGNTVRYQDEYDTRCPACGGMGRLQDFHTGEFRTCNRCNGRGLIRLLPASTNHLEKTE